VRTTVKDLPELAFGLLMYIWKQAGSDSDMARADGLGYE
jgi:hypothetical protein